MAVATKKVEGRRKLHFESFDDLSSDIDRVAASPVLCLGNWSLGQICRHLALVMNQSIDGFEFRAPFPIGLIAPLLKNRFLNKGFPAGAKFPTKAKKYLEPDPTDDAAGVSELRAAIARQQRETNRATSPFFGRMTLEEWTKLHMRHAELHLSFVVPA
jgi:hypothetical protein